MPQNLKTVSTNTISVRHRTVELKAKPKVIVKKEVYADIAILHRYVGGTEWSAPIFYTVEGDMDDLENMILTIHGLWLLDVGTESFTSYDFDEKILDAYDENPDFMSMKIGHLHTHHSMRTFFSGTDNAALHENAPQHNYFLSLIVNFACNTDCKLAFMGEETPNRYIRNNRGELIPLNPVREEVMFTADCEVIIEGEEKYINKIREIKAAKAPVLPAYNKQGYPGVYGNHYHNIPTGNPVNTTKQLPIPFDGEEAFAAKFAGIELITDEMVGSMLSSWIDGDEEKPLKEVLDGFNSWMEEDENPRGVVHHTFLEYDTIFDEFFELVNYRTVIDRSIKMLNEHAGKWSKKVADKLTEAMEELSDEL